jgi:hypothetical protein
VTSCNDRGSGGAGVIIVSEKKEKERKKNLSGSRSDVSQALRLS